MKIVEITDTHLLAPGGRLHGLDPAGQLRRAVDDILCRQADADLLVVLGDLCNDGDPQAYGLLREILAPLPFPVRLLLGNHDARPAFRAAFPDQPADADGFVQSVLDTAFGRLLFLDSHEPGMIGGRYCERRLAWLDRALAEAGDHPVTVFLHHPPVDCGLAHFRNIGLHDGGALMRRLAVHPAGVRHIHFGHIHVPLTGTSPEGIAFSSGLANAHRFVTDPAEPAPFWTGGNPCYRVLTLGPEGHRAFAVEVGQPVLSRADPCAGP